MGLATAKTPRIFPCLQHLRCPRAHRLEFAVGKEGNQHLLASDDHRYQDAARHPAYDRADWLDLFLWVLVTLYL
jgi:hypothetical protein